MRGEAKNYCDAGARVGSAADYLCRLSVRKVTDKQRCVLDTQSDETWTCNLTIRS